MGGIATNNKGQQVPVYYHNRFNRLPSAIVNRANSINHFKSLLDNYLFDSRTIFV